MSNALLMSNKAHITLDLASYPGLLTPAFVTCSTNAGEGLVKLITCNRTWTCGGVAHSFCTAVKRLSEPKKRRQDCQMSSAQSFYGSCLQSVVYSLTCCFSRMCHSSTRPGTSYHVTQFYQAFPRVSTASDKRWGEKAWVRGYNQPISDLKMAHQVTKQCSISTQPFIQLSV